MERGQPAASSWLSTWWLRRALELTRRYGRGDLLDVGCGEAPYRGFFDVDLHLTCDWPSTLHQKHAIDVYADAGALPFAAASFDTVLCTEVLEHVSDPRRVIGELSRVLRSGGHCILSVPFLYGIHEQPHDYFRFTEHGLRQLLGAASLEPVELLRRGGAVSVVSDLTAKLVSRVTRRSMKALRVPAVAQRAVLGAVVSAPQRLVAFGASAADRLAPRAASLIGSSAVTTLGYVVVARRQ